MREIKNRPFVTKQFAGKVDAELVLVAQALLPVRILQSLLAPQPAFVTYKTAQPGVAVLLKNACQFASLVAEFRVARMEPSPRRKLYTPVDRSDNSK
jgi:hypothetical protein